LNSEFEVFIGKDGKYHWRLQAENGEIIAQSEAYESEQGCYKGIFSVQANAQKATIKKVPK